MPAKKPLPLTKLWSIRMPTELLERFEQGAAKYGLPTQTYAKLIMYMGLLQEQKGGLIVVGTDADIEAAIRQNRQAVLAAKKAARKANGVTVHPTEDHEVTAFLRGGAVLTAVAAPPRSG